MPSWTSFFCILCGFFVKMCDFWTPSGIRWGQNCAPNRPNGAQISQFLHRRSVFLAVFKTTCFQDRSRSAPDGFSVDFGAIDDVSCNVLEQKLADTCTASNRNEQSRTAKYLQKSRHRNCIASVCPCAKRQQLQQTHAQNAELASKMH